MLPRGDYLVLGCDHAWRNHLGGMLQAPWGFGLNKQLSDSYAPGFHAKIRDQ